MIVRFAALLLLLLPVVPAAGKGPATQDAPAARKLYLDPAGDDDADGTAPGSAWRTLARVQREVLRPGDTVLLRRGGVWRESFWLGQSGAPGRPITFAAYGDPAAAPPTLSGGDRLDRPTRGLCFELNQSHVRLEHLRLTRSARSGRAALSIFAHKPLEDIAIVDCEFIENDTRGVWIAGDDRHSISGLRVEGCRFIDNALDGLSFDRAERSVIRANRFERNCRVYGEPWQAAIRAWSRRVRETTIERNLIRDQLWGHADTAAVGIHVDEVGEGVRVIGNDVRDVDHFGIEVENAQGVLVEDNTLVRCEIGIFVYRAGHGHVIRRNTVVDARSPGIALIGHRAGGVNAGPELEVGGALFSRNLLEANVVASGGSAALKAAGGGEVGLILRGNALGPERAGFVLWAGRWLDDYAALERASGAEGSVRGAAPFADPIRGDFSLPSDGPFAGVGARAMPTTRPAP